MYFLHLVSLEATTTLWLHFLSTSTQTRSAMVTINRRVPESPPCSLLLVALSGSSRSQGGHQQCPRDWHWWEVPTAAPTLRWAASGTRLQEGGYDAALITPALTTAIWKILSAGTGDAVDERGVQSKIWWDEGRTLSLPMSLRFFTWFPRTSSWRNCQDGKVGSQQPSEIQQRQIKVWPLGKHNPGVQHKGGSACLVGRSVEGTLRVLMGTKLSENDQHATAAQQDAGLHQQSCCQQRQRSHCHSVLSIWNPVLSFGPHCAKQMWTGWGG